MKVSRMAEKFWKVSCRGKSCKLMPFCNVDRSTESLSDRRRGSTRRALRTLTSHTRRGAASRLRIRRVLRRITVISSCSRRLRKRLCVHTIWLLELTRIVVNLNTCFVYFTVVWLCCKFYSCILKSFISVLTRGTVPHTCIKTTMENCSISIAHLHSRPIAKVLLGRRWKPMANVKIWPQHPKTFLSDRNNLR